MDMELYPILGLEVIFRTAPVVPYMSVYAKQLGFSSVVVGIIYTILPFSGMLAKPLMGAVADRFNCQKIIFLLGQLITAIMFSTMIFLPAIPNKANVDFVCLNSTTILKTCKSIDNKCISTYLNSSDDTKIMCKLSCPLTSEDRNNISSTHWNIKQDLNVFEFTTHIPMNGIIQNGNCVNFLVNGIILTNEDLVYPQCSLNSSLSFSCDIQCNSTILSNFLQESEVDDAHVYNYSAFWLLLCVYLVAWLGQAVTVSISDTICFQILKDNPIRYGNQRMFGSLGWGLFSIMSGYLVDVFSNDSVQKNYGPVFSIGVAILLLSIIVSSFLQYTPQHTSTNIIKDVGRLLSNIRIIIFIAWCICVGLCTALIWNFLFWLLEDLAMHHGCEMRSWIKTIEGFVMGIQCLAGELPFFFLSNWILKRIGHIHAMTLVLLVVGARFIFYSVITNPWHCLPIELLNGITFGLFYATMTSYASIVAPPGTETTTQGLVGAVFEGVGVASGSFIGGICFQTYGSSTTFCIYGVVAVLVGLLHAFVQYLIQNRDDVQTIDVTRSTSHEAAFMIKTSERHQNNTEEMYRKRDEY